MTAKHVLHNRRSPQYQKIYDGAKNPRTGDQIFAGWVRGSELGWAGYSAGHREPARVDFWRYSGLSAIPRGIRGVSISIRMLRTYSAMAAINANNPDLKPFQARGGKLVMYSGWADPVVPPADVVRYYEAARNAEHR